MIPANQCLPHVGGHSLCGVRAPPPLLAGALPRQQAHREVHQVPADHLAHGREEGANSTSLQGVSKRLFLGCVKLGEKLSFEG